MEITNDEIIFDLDKATGENVIGWYFMVMHAMEDVNQYLDENKENFSKVYGMLFEPEFHEKLTIFIQENVGEEHCNLPKKLGQFIIKEYEKGGKYDERR